MSDKKLSKGVGCDSDEESDEDYVPDGEGVRNLSEEEESGDAESSADEDDGASKSKRARTSAAPASAPPSASSDNNKDATSLWADFKNEAASESKPAPLPKPAPPVPVIPRSTGSLAGILGKINKKDKISVLEKSRLEWNNFKKAEGIEEDLMTHNKGKDGFLEKRDFLERTDARQFEIEKAMRSVKRSTR